MFTFPKSRTLVRALGVLFLLAVVGLGVWLIGLHLGAEYHIRQARQELERQRYQRALGEWGQALRFRPRSADLHLSAARTARQAGNLSAAREHLQQCRSLLKGVSPDLQLEEYLLRAQRGEVEEVYRYLAPYLFEEGPQTPLVLEALSHAYLFIYRFDLAWKCLDRWLQLEPDNAEALFLRGTYYTLRSRDKAAIADLRRALEIDPDRTAARLLLAQTLLDHQRSEEAAKEFAVAQEQEPSSSAALLGLATCHFNADRQAEALACLDRLPREKRDDAEVLYLRGRIAERQEKYKEAVAFLRAAFDANPAESLACHRLALCYRRLGDEASAEKYQALFDRIEKDKKRLLAITNEEKDALQSNPALCCELGEVCLRLGIKQRGLYWLNTAVRLNPQFWPAHEQLLHYYERLGPAGEKEASIHRQMLASRAPPVPKPPTAP